MKTASLTQDLEFNKEKPLTRVLFETEFTKEIRITMHKGTIMKEHKTSFPIVIEIYDGEIYLGVNGDIKHMAKGDLIALESNVPHDLKAKKNSIVRLTLTKQDKSERIQKIVNN
ncbi:cupin domain-containing protein [Psychroflexus montanilacus]|uniref:cupin n=1 Tax=Psychroflexus montanilacus TaxID=2873598 RepID=UPI001CCCCE7B|nr:cupin [Psychroflexus montanilacus]MBZ9650905.1 cupin [Psychroflexus montanilacus]